MSKTQEHILDIQENISQAPKEGFTVLLVEANPEKGFNYSYLLCYPNENMRDTLVMNCLNDYEEAIEENETENYNAIEQIYNLFGEYRITSKSKVDTSNKIQENEEKSLERMALRLRSATNHITIPIGKFEGAPIMMPLIPGYQNEGHENVASELQSEVAKKLAPQILAMIEDTKDIIQERTGKKLNEEIIDYGHSKEAQFAEHFSILCPDKIKALIFGGGEEWALPIEEIRLMIDDNRSETEQFEIKDGIPYKRVTQAEFDEIQEEYKENKKTNQRKIEQNEDKSYSLPMNYPVGIADIEEYLPELADSKNKEEYIKTFLNVPKIVFNGEYEEKVCGHYAYSTGKVPNSGKELKYGDDLAKYDDEEILDSERILGNEGVLPSIEHASMHNRVLDYISATRILFGRGDNERLKSYMDLSQKLGMNIQSKIYKDVGHRDINRSKEQVKDCNLAYSNLEQNGKIPKLDDNGRADRISPVFQLQRRYMVSKTYEDFNKKNKKWQEFTKRNKCSTPEEENEKIIGTIEKEVDDYISKRYDLNSPEVNIDRIYDCLTQAEVESIFEKIFSLDKNIEENGEKEPQIDIKSLTKNALSTNKDDIVGNEIVSKIDSQENMKEEKTANKEEVENE